MGRLHVYSRDACCQNTMAFTSTTPTDTNPRTIADDSGRHTRHMALNCLHVSHWNCSIDADIASILAFSSSIASPSCCSGLENPACRRTFNRLSAAAWFP
eukprot:GFYU01008555.1.p1 GENE.GFYU01008555.1~~GFYU01008555.1.p1  ORF type:complete len:100 (+),score=7.87 GFYU01008555.1:1-300(+)